MSTAAGISDVYLLFDASKASTGTDITVGKYVFDLISRSTTSLTSANGVVIPQDGLYNVIEMEVGEITIPNLANYVVVSSNYTDINTIPYPQYPPLILNGATDNARQVYPQIISKEMSLEIVENYPFCTTTANGFNYTFMFNVTTDTTTNSLTLTPVNSKYIFTTPKSYNSKLTLIFRGPFNSLNFSPSVLNHADVVFQPQQNPSVQAYTVNNISANPGTVDEAVYDSIHKRIYYATDATSSFYYQNIKTNTMVAFYTPTTHVRNYDYVVYSNGKVYKFPLTFDTDNYFPIIDTNTNTVSYYNYMPMTGYVAASTLNGIAMGMPVANVDGSRIYFTLRDTTRNWCVYLDTLTQKLVSYENNEYSTMQHSANTYSGGTLAPNGYILLVPSIQIGSPYYHIIDTNTNTILKYVNISVSTTNPFVRGIVLDDSGTIAYLIPADLTATTKWQRLIIDKLKLETFAVGFKTARGTTAGYSTGVMTINGNMFLAPETNALSEPIWHYIDTVNLTVVEYSSGSVIPAGRFFNKFILTENLEMYFNPSSQWDTGPWYKIVIGTVYLMFKYPNHGLLPYDRIFVTDYSSSIPAIDTYINRTQGLLIDPTFVDANYIKINPIISLNHNTINCLSYYRDKTRSKSVNIISKTFHINMRMRMLKSTQTNSITAV